jgi:hypothetical protein
MSIEQLNSPRNILIIRNVLYFHSDILADNEVHSIKALIIKYYQKLRLSKIANQPNPLLKLDKNDSSVNQRNQENQFQINGQIIERYNE